MKIGIDLLGGDTPPDTLFRGVLDASKQIPDTHQLILFCTPAVHDQFLKTQKEEMSRLPASLKWSLVSQQIEMGENPATAVRHKKDSSLVVGITSLKQKSLDAFITSGNTGALVAACYHLLPLKAGIKRPALMVTLKTAKGDVAMLDVGGTVGNEKDHLVRLAKMGVDALRDFKGIKKPRVALLNIGVESMKGTAELKSAYDILMLENPSFEFIGNIESKDVFQGGPDLIVTDGFTGNMFIKTAEGLSAHLLTQLKEKLPKEDKERLSPFLSDFGAHFSQDLNPSAMLIGVESLVMKCHGATTQRAFSQAICNISRAQK